MHIATNNSCTFVELPRLDESYALVKRKYENRINNFNGYRTILKI